MYCKFIWTWTLIFLDKIKMRHSTPWPW